MNYSRIWSIVRSALRNPSITLIFTGAGQADGSWRLPWWLCLLLGALPLPILLRKNEDPANLLLAGVLLFFGLLLALAAVFSLGKGGGSKQADLARLPLAFILFVTAGLALAVNLRQFDALITPKPAGGSVNEAQINAELAVYPWQEVAPAAPREIGPVRKILLVDASTHQLFAWQTGIVEPVHQAQSLAESDLILLIDAHWQDAPNSNWLTISEGLVTAKRPVKYIQWKISVLDPLSKEIIAEETFDGPIAPADFIELSQRFKSDAEIEEWEKINCPPPLLKVREWLLKILA